MEITVGLLRTIRIALPWVQSCLRALSSLSRFTFVSPLRTRPLTMFDICPVSLRSLRSQISTSKNDYAEEYKIKLDSLKPNEQFLSTLNSQQRGVIDRLIKELKVYLWMAPTAPDTLDDEHWRRLMKCESISDRVSFLRYLALSQHRAKADMLKKKAVDEEFIKQRDAEREKFSRGEMGYGPGMYQLMLNPLRSKKRVHQEYGARVWRTLRLDEKPHIVFDMQFIDEMHDRRRSIIGNQMQFLISENFRRAEPFQLTFANFNDQREENKQLLHKFVGFYSGEHTNQIILPDFINKDVHELYPNEEEIVYISRYGREVLDGPLRHKVYIICASYDLNRESIGAARRGSFHAMRLPFKRYVRWQSGPQFLPFINLLRVLDEVYQSNGDWKSALLNNISKRHLRSVEETTAYATFNSEKMKERKRQMEELVKMIEDATANV